MTGLVTGLFIGCPEADHYRPVGLLIIAMGVIFSLNVMPEAVAMDLVYFTQLLAGCNIRYCCLLFTFRLHPAHSIHTCKMLCRLRFGLVGPKEVKGTIYFMVIKTHHWKGYF